MQNNFILNCLIEFFKLDFFLNGLKKYSYFGGRESRKAFFLFQLSVFFIFLGVNVFAERFDKYIYLLSYIIFMFPPVISSMVRRLHDVGKSGFVLPVSLLSGSLFFIIGVLSFNGSDFMVGLITILSFLIMLYPVFLFFKASEPSLNKYDTQKSRPVYHGIMLIFFILIFMFFLYILGSLFSQVEVLQQESPLTVEETKEIDNLIQNYKMKK